jgi:hypothetical protein
MKIEPFRRTEPALTTAPLANSQVFEAPEPGIIPNAHRRTNTHLMSTMPRHSTAHQLEVSTAHMLELLEHDSELNDGDRGDNSVGPAQFCHPNGYALESILHSCVYAAVRRIQVCCERDVVVLRGFVPCFFQKQIVLSLTMKHAPGAQIVDFIRVDYR